MKSDLEWKEWGLLDPLYAVATWNGRSKKGKHPWTNEEFYSIGEMDWKDFRNHWNNYGVHFNDCLEIGCGAGRLTKQLAQSFATVTALDVSTGMINYAKEHIKDKNVTFVLSDGSHLSYPNNSFDAVFSTHVFQHFNSHKDVSMILQEIFRIMKSGGTVMIHLPIYNWPNYPRLYNVTQSVISLLQNSIVSMKRVAIKLGLWLPVMKLLHFDMEWIDKRMKEIGFQDIEYRYFRVKSNGSMHPFMFAAKRSTAREVSGDVDLTGRL
jgi:ubiquinone/menaquinone biosynthesis C-methylase UbiE